MTHRAPTQREIVGICWYNRLSEARRAHWHRVADSPRPVDAFEAYSRFKDGRS